MRPDHIGEYTFEKCSLKSPDELSGLEELLQSSGLSNPEGSYLQCDNSFDTVKGLDNCYLLRDAASRVVSVITLFFPYEKEIELSCLTEPASRGRGLFSFLYARVREDIEHAGFQRILFVRNSAFDRQFDLPSHLGCSYVYSEYAMRIEPEEAVALRFPDRPVFIRRAHSHSRELLIEMNMEIFEEEREPTGHLIDTILSSESKRMLIAYSSEEEQLPLGLCAYSPEHVIFLFSIGILPDFRGRGYGKAMITQILRTLCRRYHRPVMLEVDSKNTAALALYRACGFQVTESNDYYSLSLVQ